MSFLSFQIKNKENGKEKKLKKLRVIDIPLITPTDINYSNFDYEEIKRQIGVSLKLLI